MALSRTDVHSQISADGHGTGTFVTSSFTPPDNCLLVVCVSMMRVSDSNDPSAAITCAGGGLTFTPRLTFGSTGQVFALGLRIFTAPVTTGASMTITAGSGGIDTQHYAVTVLAYTGYDTGSPIGATGTDFEAAAPDGPQSFNLSGAPVPSSEVAAFWELDKDAAGTTPGGTWTEISDLQTGSSGGLQTQVRTTSVSQAVEVLDTNTGGSIFKFIAGAVEIKAADGADSVPTVEGVGVVAEGVAAVTPAMPTHVADDVLLAYAEHAENSALTTGTAGWAAVPDSPVIQTATQDTTLDVWWKRATGAGTAGPTFNDPGNHIVAVGLVIRGCIATGDPWDVTAQSLDNTADTSASVTGDTTTGAERLILNAIAAGVDVGSDGTAQFSAWADSSLTGVTERVDVARTVGNGGSLGIASGVKETAGGYGPMTATLANAAVKAMHTVALKPPAGGGGAVTVDLAGTLPALTGSFDVDASATVGLAGVLPALVGSFTVDAAAGVDLAGQLPALTGSFDLEASAGVDLAGVLPAVTGSFGAEASADVDLAGTLPQLLGSFDVAVEGGTVTVAFAGTLPQLVGGFDIESLATVDLAGVLPGLTGSFDLQSSAEAVVAGMLPALDGGFTINASAEVALAGVLPQLVGAFALDAGTPTDIAVTAAVGGPAWTAQLVKPAAAIAAAGPAASVLSSSWAAALGEHE